MKTKCFSLIFLGLLLLLGCNKDSDMLVEAPSFDVIDYTLRDGIDSLGNPVKQIVFNLEGNADIISFFSGEVFHEHAYKDGHVIKVDELNMSFEYMASVGAGTDPEWDQLSVHATTSFDGTVTEEGEGWTDITERFELPKAMDVTARTTTRASISDLVVPGQPLYIAFKYVTPARTVSAAYTTWDIHEFKVEAETSLGPYIMVNQRDVALPLYHFGPDDGSIPDRSARSVSTATRLRFRANILADHMPFTAGVWAVAPPIMMGDEIDFGPDRPIGVKSRIDPALREYAYVYEEPGTYKVAFVASNVTTKGEAKVVRELEVVVP